MWTMVGEVLWWVGSGDVVWAEIWRIKLCQPCKEVKKEPREQQMQRPWGGNEFGKLEEKKGGWHGLSWVDRDETMGEGSVGPEFAPWNLCFLASLGVFEEKGYGGLTSAPRKRCEGNQRLGSCLSSYRPSQSPIPGTPSQDEETFRPMAGFSDFQPRMWFTFFSCLQCGLAVLSSTAKPWCSVPEAHSPLLQSRTTES